MAQETDNSKQAIEQLLEKYAEAWNIHDAKAFSLLFAEDADFTNVFGQSFHGRSAIEAQHAPIFSTMFRLSHLILTETRVRFLSENLTAVDVPWKMSGATDRQGNPWPDRKGLLNFIMKNEKQIWSILIMHNMDLPVALSK